MADFESSEHELAMRAIQALREDLSIAMGQIAELEVLVKGRNRSAPTKRNMTDDDALRVLTGDLKALNHKDAGEQGNLTYAQVYSARLGYTFKHVHKDLREGGWKNTWEKK